MKTLVLLFIGATAIIVAESCNRAEARFLDLTSGERVELVEDSETGMMVDKETRQPVRLYVDTKTRDTIWGPTGEVVNGMVVRTSSGEWKYKNEQTGEKYKMEVEKDGDYKIKSGEDAKIKYNDGEYKIKRGDYKKEVEKDGDITIKDGKKKIKIDGETGEQKVKIDD